MKLSNKEYYFIGVASLLSSVITANILGSFILLILGMVLCISAIIKEDRKKAAERTEWIDSILIKLEDQLEQLEQNEKRNDSFRRKIPPRKRR